MTHSPNNNPPNPGTEKTADFTYCGDRLSSKGIIYQQGRRGALSDMDVDCDGVQGSPADDGRCGSSGDTQSVTSFADTVRGYGKAGVRDLDANVHPYVVFGNVGSRPGYANFNPRSYGVEPLSVVAVVCGDKLVSSFSYPFFTLLSPSRKRGTCVYVNGLHHRHTRDKRSAQIRRKSINGCSFLGGR